MHGVGDLQSCPVHQFGGDIYCAAGRAGSKEGFGVRRAVSRSCTCSLLSALPLPCSSCQAFFSLSLIHSDCHLGERLDPGLATLSRGTFWFVWYLNTPVIKIQAVFRC